MDNSFLIVKDIDSAVTTISLNRPEKRNALNLALMEELCTVCEQLDQNPSKRVLILHGEGTTFCAGLDLQEAVDLSLVEKSAQTVSRLLTTFYTSPLVTIAAVHGAAIAGGAGLMLACDFAIAAKGTRIGFPEIRRGIVAAQVATVLCRQVRMREVRELLLLGELVDTERALAMGLINRVVDPQALLSEAEKIAEIILKGAPGSVKETKRLLESLDPSSLAKDLKIALSFHHAARYSQEFQEGTAAFLDKRPPKWEKKMEKNV
jgi:methylglutaconyl-CoA hydratase